MIAHTTIMNKNTPYSFTRWASGSDVKFCPLALERSCGDGRIAIIQLGRWETGVEDHNRFCQTLAGNVFAWASGEYKVSSTKTGTPDRNRRLCTLYLVLCSFLVGERRVELLRLAALDPKSSVSAIPPLARSMGGKVVDDQGLEPWTNGLRVHCSTN